MSYEKAEKKITMLQIEEQKKIASYLLLTSRFPYGWKNNLDFSFAEERFNELKENPQTPVENFGWEMGFNLSELRDIPLARPAGRLVGKPVGTVLVLYQDNWNEVDGWHQRHSEILCLKIAEKRTISIEKIKAFLNTDKRKYYIPVEKPLEVYRFELQEIQGFKIEWRRIVALILERDNELILSRPEIKMPRSGVYYIRLGETLQDDDSILPKEYLPLLPEETIAIIYRFYFNNGTLKEDYFQIFPLKDLNLEGIEDMPI